MFCHSHSFRLIAFALILCSKSLTSERHELDYQGWSALPNDYGEPELLNETTDLVQERFLESAKNVTGNLQTGVALFTNPQGALGFLFNVSVAYVLVQAMWVFAHFLFWDFTQTLPAEEFSVAALVAFWKNPDVAIFNQLAIWGSALTASIIFLLPPILLNVFPSLAQGLGVIGRKRRSVWVGSNSQGGRRNLPTLTESDFQLAVRRTLCPICVARLVVFNSLAFLASVVLWNFTPFLRNSTPTSASAGRKRQRRRRNEEEHMSTTRMETEQMEEFLDSYQATLIDSLIKYES